MAETYVEVECSTWNKDTHGLFDYDTNTHSNSKFLIWDSGIITRIQSSCKFTQILSSLHISAPEEKLVQIRRKHDKFLLQTVEPATDLWAVNKLTYGNDGYTLKEGDTMKLGRIILKVKRISRGVEETIGPNEALYCEDIDELSKESTCRICCCEEENESNPLIAPCKCIGSVKHIHVDCIKKWLESRINCRSTNRVSTYHWSDLSCEICKAPLPHSIRHKNKVFDLVIIKFPTSPYIVLEDCKSDESSQTMHLIDLQNSHSIMVGRGHDCDIRLADISVSRKHAKIFMDGGKFWIKDCGSKFGTLIKLNQELTLEKDKLVALQINRTVVKMKFKVRSSCWVFCCESDSPKVLRGNWPETDPHSPTSFRIK